ADADGAIVVKDLASGATTHLRGAPSDVWDARLSPNGRFAAAATEDSRLYVWDLRHPGAAPRKLAGHRGNLGALDFSSDGRIVTGGSDRTMRIWSPPDWRQVILRGDTDEVLADVFTPDGRHVLSANADGSVRFWDAGGGDALVDLQQGETVLTDVVE